MKTIFFDMDGTIADLYNVENWLQMLISSDTTPYEIAKPLLRLSTLARLLRQAQKKGYKIGIISWLSKSGTPDYNDRVTAAKVKWLKKHLPSVEWDEINIVKYGFEKWRFATSEEDILFDDESRNRDNWTGVAYDETRILDILKSL